MEADGAVDAQNAPTVPWKTLCVFHELPQGLSNQITHEKPRKAPKWRGETRIDPKIWCTRLDGLASFARQLAPEGLLRPPGAVSVPRGFPRDPAEGSPRTGAVVAPRALGQPYLPNGRGHNM